MIDSKYFQDHMPGNLCYGCGRDNHEGLKISSYWEDDESICIWSSKEKYQGWKGVLNGGVLATLIDCHAMCTAMAAAYKAENRPLDSLPTYKYATGTMNIRYQKPTSNESPIELRARALDISNKKVLIECKVYSEGIQTATAEVLAIKVYDSSNPKMRFGKE